MQVPAFAGSPEEESHGTVGVVFSFLRDGLTPLRPLLSDEWHPAFVFFQRGYSLPSTPEAVPSSLASVSNITTRPPNHEKEKKGGTYLNLEFSKKSPLNCFSFFQ